MKIEIVNRTGNVADTEVRDIESGLIIPCTKIEINPLSAEDSGKLIEAKLTVLVKRINIKANITKTKET